MQKAIKEQNVLRANIVNSAISRLEEARNQARKEAYINIEQNDEGEGVARVKAQY
jgi:hypothetical protein